MLYQRGLSRSWVLLAGSFSGAQRMIDANFNQLWVESQNGSFFRADIQFNCAEQDVCWTWEAIQNIADIPKQDVPARRSMDCESLQEDIFPWNPKGQIKECLYTRLLGAESGSEGYFVLLADGNVLYWWNGGSLIEAQALFILSTIIVPIVVAGIIAVLFGARSYLSLSRKTNEAAKGEAG